MYAGKRKNPHAKKRICKKKSKTARNHKLRRVNITIGDAKSFFKSTEEDFAAIYSAGMSMMACEACCKHTFELSKWERHVASDEDIYTFEDLFNFDEYLYEGSKYIDATCGIQSKTSRFHLVRFLKWLHRGSELAEEYECLYPFASLNFSARNVRHLQNKLRDWIWKKHGPLVLADALNLKISTDCRRIIMDYLGI